MARFLFWSDLHCEHAPFEVPKPRDAGGEEAAPRRDEIDAILIAGDIDLKGRHVALMRQVWDLWRCPVLAVAGNHEPYDSKRYQKHLAQEADLIAQARADGADVTVLRDGATRIIGDTRIIGATLWTDMLLFGDHSGMTRITCKDQLNDYSSVRWYDETRGIYRKMIPADTIGMHMREKAAIFAQARIPFEGPTLVMTHHLPVAEMLSARRLEERKMVSAAYASDLREEIATLPIDGWICGHSHDAREYDLEGLHGPIAFRRNIRGYPGDVSDFDPLRLLDSNALQAPRPEEEDHAPSP